QISQINADLWNQRGKRMGEAPLPRAQQTRAGCPWYEAPAPTAARPFLMPATPFLACPPAIRTIRVISLEGLRERVPRIASDISNLSVRTSTGRRDDIAQVLVDAGRERRSGVMSDSLGR